ncbi:MAG: hypothetical protein ACRC52_10595, partial [Aeromonas veronii]
MPGLLDFFNESPRFQGVLGRFAEGVAAGDSPFSRGFAGAYRADERKAARKRAEEAEQAKMDLIRAQAEQYRSNANAQSAADARQAEASDLQRQKRGLMQQFLQPGRPEQAGTAGLAEQMPQFMRIEGMAPSEPRQAQAPSFNKQGYAQALMKIDPEEAMKMMAPPVREIKEYSTMLGPNGKPVQVAMYKDGTVEAVNGFSPTPKMHFQDLGGQVMAIDQHTGQPMSNFGKTNTPDAIMSDRRQRDEGAANRGVTMRGQNMTDARAKANQASQDRQVQWETGANGSMFALPKTWDMRSPVAPQAIPAMMGGQPFMDGKSTTAKNLAQSSRLMDQIGGAESLLKQGPTGSYAGAAMDGALKVVGVSRKAADTAAQLETIAGWMTSNVPRMEGPQSDKDVAVYQQMAAKVGDRTTPVDSRIAALQTLRTL